MVETRTRALSKKWIDRVDFTFEVGGSSQKSILLVKLTEIALNALI